MLFLVLFLLALVVFTIWMITGTHAPNSETSWDGVAMSLFILLFLLSPFALLSAILSSCLLCTATEKVRPAIMLAIPFIAFGAFVLFASFFEIS